MTLKLKSKFLVILGPTATGKTDLALHLAKKFNGELVSCDSRQVYKGLDVGTGKMPSNGQLIIDNGQLKKGKGFWEIGGIRVWMYDVVSPKKQYTVADYVKDADRVVRDIQEKGKLPIIVGGTGLYLKALLYGLSNLSIPIDKKLRQEFEELTVSQLQEKLKEISPEKWHSLNYSDSQNPRRLIRAIEIATMSLRGGRKSSGLSSRRGNLIKNKDILKIGLTASREILYQRADKRVISRIKRGMIEEAERERSEGVSLKRMRQLGLEYGVLADYLDGKIRDISGKWGLIKILQNKIHGYVRRQLTWFKKEKDINWFDITDKNYLIKIEKLIRSWYDSPKD